MPLAVAQYQVNGGANVSGGQYVPSEATIDFSSPDTNGWLRARWEIYDYPEGWATPAGWTLDGSSGIIHNSAFAPPQIVLPSSSDLWGVWMVRLLVNEQLDDDQNTLDGLLDDLTAISMASPSGLVDIGAREKWHFTTAITKVKRWLLNYQRNLRRLENPVVSATSDEVTPVVVRRYPVPTGGVKVLRAVVKVRDATGAIFGEWEVKGAWNRVAGVLAELYPPVITLVIESDVGLDVTITLDGNLAVELNGVGLAGTDLIWESQEAFF